MEPKTHGHPPKSGQLRTETFRSQEEPGYIHTRAEQYKTLDWTKEVNPRGMDHENQIKIETSIHPLCHPDQTGLSWCESSLSDGRDVGPNVASVNTSWSWMMSQTEWFNIS